MKKYLPRIIDKLLSDRLKAKGAVLLEGPKWCGKTTSAKEIAGSFISMDQPEMIKQYQSMAELSPLILLEGETPRLIDEWQIAPNLWNAVRYEVDQRDEFGQFILTGSAVPAEIDESMHTGTGRISRLYMRPMSLYESEDSNGKVTIRDLFANKEISAKNDTDLEEIAFLICRGGWPKAVGLAEKKALFQAIDYFEAIVSADISRVDSVKRDKEKAKRFLKSYARNVGTRATLETIRQDVLANHTGTFDPVTLYSYRDALTKIFVIEDSPAWNPKFKVKGCYQDNRYEVFCRSVNRRCKPGLGPKKIY